MVRLHSPATERLQIFELKIIKLILTKKLEASLLACSEDWQQHFRAAPQSRGFSSSHRAPHRSPARALCKGSSPTVPTEHNRPSYSRQGQSSNDQTTPNVPVLQLCCPRQHFPNCSSPHNPAVVVMLQFHLQVLGLNSSPRLLVEVKVKSHSLGLTAVRNIPPSSVKHCNSISSKNLYQGLSLGLLHSSWCNFHSHCWKTQWSNSPKLWCYPKSTLTLVHLDLLSCPSLCAWPTTSGRTVSSPSFHPALMSLAFPCPVAETVSLTGCTFPGWKCSLSFIIHLSTSVPRSGAFQGSQFFLLPPHKAHQGSAPPRQTSRVSSQSIKPVLSI